MFPWQGKLTHLCVFMKPADGPQHAEHAASALDGAKFCILIAAHADSDVFRVLQLQQSTLTLILMRQISNFNPILRISANVTQLGGWHSGGVLF